MSSSPMRSARAFRCCPATARDRLVLRGISTRACMRFWVASADLNKDGHADVVTANTMSNDVSVLLGDGSGGFAAEVRYAVGNSPTSIAIGYVDDDAYPDLVAANLSGGDVSVLLGDGSGAFGAAQNFSIAEGFESPYAVALGDANEDGTPRHRDGEHEHLQRQHLAAARRRRRPLRRTGDAAARRSGLLQPAGDCIHRRDRRRTRGHRHGEPRPEQSCRCSRATVPETSPRPCIWTPIAGPVVVAAADVTGDGNVDLVTSTRPRRACRSWPATAAAGSPRRQISRSIPRARQDYTPWPWGMALGDVTGDGNLDIVTANTQNDTISVLPNDGAGGFATFSISTPARIPARSRSPTLTATGGGRDHGESRQQQYLGVAQRKWSSRFDLRRWLRHHSDLAPRGAAWPASVRGTSKRPISRFLPPLPLAGEGWGGGIRSTTLDIGMFFSRLRKKSPRCG